MVIEVPEGVPRDVVERAVKKEMARIERLRSVRGVLSLKAVEKVIEEIEGGIVP